MTNFRKEDQAGELQAFKEKDSFASLFIVLGLVVFVIGVMVAFNQPKVKPVEVKPVEVKPVEAEIKIPVEAANTDIDIEFKGFKLGEEVTEDKIKKSFEISSCEFYVSNYSFICTDGYTDLAGTSVSVHAVIESGLKLGFVRIHFPSNRFEQITSLYTAKYGQPKTTITENETTQIRNRWVDEKGNILIIDSHIEHSFHTMSHTWFDKDEGDMKFISRARNEREQIKLLKEIEEKEEKEKARAELPAI